MPLLLPTPWGAHDGSNGFPSIWDTNGFQNLAMGVSQPCPHTSTCTFSLLPHVNSLQLGNHLRTGPSGFLGSREPVPECGDGPAFAKMDQRGLTLHIRATGMLLNVLSMLAFTPGGGSNTKMRPARSRFTGT